MIGFDRFLKSKKREIMTVEDIVARIKKGDKYLRETFINDYTPFVVKTLSKSMGKYIDMKNSEEFSIGLIAFNEAIDSYNEDRGVGFLNYSSIIINRRLIDYFRKDKKYNNTYPFTYFEENMGCLEEKHTQTFDLFERIETKEEIEQFKLELLAYGITLKDLVTSSPKHKDSIRLCIEIARLIAEESYLYGIMTRKKSLPLSELTKVCNVHKRTLERNRKFIIATVIILKSKLSVLKSYVRSAEGGDLNRG